jgi:hypothetical protein
VWTRYAAMAANDPISMPVTSQSDGIVFRLFS